MENNARQSSFASLIFIAPRHPKRRIRNLSFLIPVILTTIGCLNTPRAAGNPGGMTLDRALREAAGQIDRRIAAGTKIAPLNFNSPSDKFSAYVLEELTACFLDTGKLTVVDRKEVDLIRGEFNFQLSGDVGDDSMQELGRMLGAQSIVSGSLTDMGGFYRIVIRVLNVQNASVEVQYRTNIVNDTIVTALLTGGTAEAAGPLAQVPAQPPAAQAPARAPSAPPLPPYTVGDIGPAGGIVFYDMGFYMDGWRYLEAAPQDFPINAKWTSAGIGTFSTETGVGTGKQNTSYLLSFLRGQGETMRAAQVVGVPEYGGYADWFLPSKDELNLMYENLKKQRIGEFSNKAYWSSSGGIRHGTDWNLVAWQIDFSDGAQSRAGGSADALVRAVRRF